MAEYRCVKHQTSRCDMDNKKFSTPNFLIISKSYQNKNLFYLLALSVSAQNDKHKVFFVDQIIKKAKNQNGQPIMSHRDARGFSSKSFWKHFLIVLKILLQVPIIPSYFYKHSDVAYQEKNTLGNLKNWITSHRDVFSKCWKKFVKVFFSHINLLGSWNHMSCTCF